MSPLFFGGFVVQMPMLSGFSVRPEFIRYTAEEIEALRAAGDTEGVDLAEQMNAACDLGEGVEPTP